MGYSRFQKARNFKHKEYRGGNLSLTSTTWADLPTIGTTKDIVLAAEVGDVIEVSLTALVGANTNSAFFDAVSIVSSSPVNSWGSDAAPDNSHEGIQAWRCDGTSGSVINPHASGSYWRTLVSGDLSSGTVTIRVRYRVSGGTISLLNDATRAWQFFAANIGPEDPH